MAYGIDFQPIHGLYLSATTHIPHPGLSCHVMCFKGLSWKFLLAVSGSVAVVALTLSLAYINQKTYERAAVYNSQYQLLAAARATAKRIQEYIEDRQRYLKILSDNPDVQHDIFIRKRQVQDNNSYCLIRSVFRLLCHDTDAVTLLDAKGVMLHRHPFIPDEIGKDHSDKPGVSVVIRTHKPYVSGLFVNDRGNYAISFSRPVFYRGKFVGLVRFMVQMDTIYRRFLMEMEPDGQTCAWLVDSKAVVLSHKDRQRIGRPFFPSDPSGQGGGSLTAMKAVLADIASGREGWAVLSGEDGRKRIVAYAPVRVGNRRWSAGICRGYSEVAGPIMEHARYTWMLSGVVLLFFLAGGLLFLRSNKKKAELRAEAKYFRQLARSAERLRENEAKLSGIISSITDSMFMVDRNYVISWANDVARELFGQELVGRKCYEAFHGMNEPCRLCVASRCLRDDGVHESETQFRMPNGDELILWCTASVAARDSGQKPEMVVGICRDITGRKMAEKEREQLIRELQEALSDVKVLSGMLPICASCKKIRDDKGYWNQLEEYISSHSDVVFSHSICPECRKRLYGDWLEKDPSENDPG